MGPLVSVVMSVFNGGAYLKETLDSLFRQEYSNIEVIVVDDCSYDNTMDILSGVTDKRLIVLKNGKNMRLAYSLNRAISIAKGKYIARMDADDICLSKRLVKQVSFLERHNDIDVLGGNYRAFGKTTKKSDYQTDHEWIKTGLLFENTMCHPAIMFRKNAIEQWYDEKFVASQDYDLWTRLIFNHKFHNLRDIILKYRVHDDQTVKVLSAYQKKGADTARYRMLQNVFCKTFLEKNAELFGEFCISKLEKIAEVPVGHFLPTGYQCRHS